MLHTAQCLLRIAMLRCRVDVITVVDHKQLPAMCVLWHICGQSVVLRWVVCRLLGTKRPNTGSLNTTDDIHSNRIPASSALTSAADGAWDTDVCFL